MNTIKRNLYSHILLGHALFSISVSLILSSIIFHGLGKNDFFYLGDEFLVFSNAENFSLSFLRSAVSLGTPNGIPLVLNFFEHMYFYVAYGILHMSTQGAEYWSYIIGFFSIVFVPYIGFRKLSQLYFNTVDEGKMFIISLWYSFNTYTMITWSDTFYFSFVILYSLSPLLIYYVHLVIFKKTTLVMRCKAALLLFLCSFIIYEFAVMAIFLSIYILIMCIMHWKQKKLYIRNIGIILLILIPLYVFFIPSILDIFSNFSGTASSLSTATAGNLSGGFLYQLLLWSVWPIYNIWEPRTGFTFYKYLYLPWSILAPFILYGLVIWGGMVQKKKKEVFVITITSFLVFLLFAKGPQPPFEEIYSFLITHFTPFILFRSPDNKFGYGIVLTVAIMLLLVSNEYRRRFFLILIGIVAIVQGLPLFTGNAIRGENSKVSSTRFIHIPVEYTEVASYINSHSNMYGYVLSLPSSFDSAFTLEKRKLFIGQDLLEKLVADPFLYSQKEAAMSQSTFNTLNLSILNADFTVLNTFPIRYILVRNDIQNLGITKSLQMEITQHFQKVFQNSQFVLFKDTTSVPIISARDAVYTMVNPIQFSVLLKHVSAYKVLQLNESYNKGWKIYIEKYKDYSCLDSRPNRFANNRACKTTENYFQFGNLRYVFDSSIMNNTHDIGNGYANQWNISSKLIKKYYSSSYYKINPDGSLNVLLTIYFQPQSWFYAVSFISGITCIAYVFIILGAHYESRRL